MQQSYIMIKREAYHLKKRRPQCNLHSQLIKYHCQHPQCIDPYLCQSEECIDQHFHEEKLVIARFEAKMWESKFQEVQSIINNETLKVKEEQLTKIVNYFTQKLQKIHRDMQNFESCKEQLCNSKLQKLKPQYFDNINGFLCLGNHLERKLDGLRAKIIEDQILFDGSLSPQTHIIEDRSSNHRQQQQPINEIIQKSVRVVDQSSHQSHHSLEMPIVILKQSCMESQERQIEYFEDKDLTVFLRKHIKNFSWQQCNVVFCSKTNFPTCQKFHQKLKNMCNLLFLFMGQNEIIGSYFEEPYPSVAERIRKDQQSFIFIKDMQLDDKFQIFTANHESEFHMTISDKLLICQGNTPNKGDGLRTFQRNFETLAYFLPSLSFSSTKNDKSYNGILKIKSFYILQIRGI